MDAPDAFRPIANIHFALDSPMPLPPMIGVINATTQWIFRYPGRVSVTISNSTGIEAAGREDLARRIWSEVTEVAGVHRPMPPWQVIHERRATFACVPSQEIGGLPPRPALQTSSSPATGRRPACRRPSRVRFAPAGVPLALRHQRSVNMHGAENAVRVGRPAVDRVPEEIDLSVGRAAAALRNARRPDGHWCFELEADATIPAEYVLFTHYLGERADTELERRIGNYLRRRRTASGGWPLYHGGAFNISASVKAYFALKMIGDDPDDAHMRQARAAVQAHGGAEGANVFTRILLALYGIVPWSAVPQMPVEIMLLPAWFPFHLSKISYWARTVLVPLLVLQALKPRARNARAVSIDELFIASPGSIGQLPRGGHQHAGWFAFFRAADMALRGVEPLLPQRSRRRAIEKATAFVRERLNGEDGLGAIFPAMVNAVMMFDTLGYAPDDPDRAAARRAVDRLLVVGDDEAYCQPCVSPVWDTVLAGHALLEAGDGESVDAAGAALDWLASRQECGLRGDWAFRRPGLEPGGWAFQYANPHYPDLDDTAVIVMAMDRFGREPADARHETAIRRAERWIEGLQSRNGGWAAFDADNMNSTLDNIPFSDHGALLDPPSPDLTARCVSMLAQRGAKPETSPALRAGLDYLNRTQRPEGSWFGRWGINYIYGTWSALSALNAAGIPADAPGTRRATRWLISIQNEDGGWGEEGDASYRLDYDGHRPSPSSVSQTAWALLGLMAAGVVDDEAVTRGIAWLMGRQGDDGLWSEPQYTGTGFPRVFYLRYHGYAKYFPLLALARYRRLARATAVCGPAYERPDRAARGGERARLRGGNRARCRRPCVLRPGRPSAFRACRGACSSAPPASSVSASPPVSTLHWPMARWSSHPTSSTRPAGRSQPTSNGARSCAGRARPSEGTIIGLGAPVLTVAGKQRLFARTGAMAADMESHLASRIAERHGLRFAALRAISDAAGTAVPEVALAGVRADGSTVRLRCSADWRARRAQLRRSCAWRWAPRGRNARYSAPDVALALASDWWISASFASTWRSWTFSAGRWRSSGMSGTIGLSVSAPRRLALSALSGCRTESLTAVAS